MALFVVTAALALLLAVRYHLAWPSVLVAIGGTVPALYVAWLAVPGVRSPPEPAIPGKLARGRQAAQWNPVDLGVHQVIGGGPMPGYIRRPHDELLRAVLDPAVPASRLVVVRGGSSTGKTRAAYEAVVSQLSAWHLDYPLNVAALKERLDSGIPGRTVLWLGELRQYADAKGGAEVLGRLADLLAGEGYLLITTVWPEHWNTYTAAARTGPGAADPAGTVGRLLDGLPELTGRGLARLEPARGGVIDVPPEFTETDLQAAVRTGDPALAAAAEAAASAGQPGQVTQYLAGVPDLLDRYEGPGDDYPRPYGQAIITAAMDATRLGHASLLPAALLQEAAVGYLTDTQRTKDIAIWRETALTWAAEELRGAVRALQPVPPPSGTGIAGYQAADYLDQHGRRTRQDQLGPLSLWDALTTHVTSALDLNRLGQAARDRGLYRRAAALWTTAATLGSAVAARQLITHLCQVSPDDTTRAAQWIVSHVSLDDPGDVAELLQELDGAGAGDAACALADRAAARASLDDPGGVAELLVALREAAAGDAVRTLLDRDPAAHVSLGRPWGVAELLRELARAAGADAVRTLLDRDPNPWASVDDPEDVGELLRELARAAAGGVAVRTLLDRDPAAHVSLDRPWGVARLLQELDGAGADDAVRTLLDRDPAARASLDDPEGVAELLQALREAAAGDAVRTLLDRDPAARASLDDPGGVAKLLRELARAAAGDAARALADQAANAGMFDLFLQVHPGEAPSYLFGREPDGAPSQSWRWQEPTS